MLSPYVRYISSIDRPDGIQNETWTATETLTLIGIDIRFLLSGMTVMQGNAEVSFTNGERTFTQNYDVLATYSEGLAFSIGGSVTKTNYSRSFESGISDMSVKKSFEGLFVSAGVSFVPKQLSYALVSVSPTGGYTFSIDGPTKLYDPKGWQGPTGGAGSGLGLPQLNVTFSLLATSYKLPESEWQSEWFYNMVFPD